MPLGEIHCHSTASDGSLSPMELVRLARSKGLRAVSVTDHNTWRGSTLAVRAAAIIGGVTVVPGNEVRTDVGDVLVYCDRPHPDEATPRELERLREWADDNGCILVAAHPYHIGRKSIGRRISRLASLFDAIEVWNSRGIPLLNLPAMRLAERLGMPGTSGSDAHVGRELGTSPVILPDDPRGPEDVLEWIRKGSLAPTLGLPGPMAIAEAAAWSIARRI